ALRVDLRQALRRGRVVRIRGQRPHVQLDGLLFVLLGVALPVFTAQAALDDQRRLAEQGRLGGARALAFGRVQEQSQRGLQLAVVPPHARQRRQRAGVVGRDLRPLVRRLRRHVPPAQA